MKRIAIIATFLFAIIMTVRSQGAEPDFAYPQTVSKDANAQLKKSLSQGDGQGAIEALLQITVADALVNGGIGQPVIDQIGEAAAKLDGNPLQGVAYALQANCYAAYYSADQWRFDERDVPADVMPADISEWGASQFKARINELLEKSFAPADQLAAMPLADYTRIVESDSVGRVFYPTMLDFVCANAYRVGRKMSREIIEDAMPLRAVELALSYAAPLSAPAVAWECERARMAKKPEEALRQAYLDNEGSPYAPMLLEAYYMQHPGYSEYGVDIVFVDDDDDAAEMTKHRWVYDECAKLRRGQVDKLMKPVIDNIVNDLSRQEATTSYPDLCGLGQNITVNVHYENIGALTLNVYRYDESLRDTNTKKMQRAKPYRTVELQLPGAVPFKGDTTVAMSFDTPGYYYIVPSGGKLNTDYSADYVRCVGVYPVAINRCDRTYVAVVDPVTGAPMPGVTVKALDNKTTVYTAVTDSKGLADMTPAVAKGSTRTLQLTAGGHKYDFNIGLSGAYEHYKGNDHTISVNTDRALYHPGDKVGFVAVVSMSTTGADDSFEASLCAGVAVKAVLYDANNQKVGTVEGVTDAYGRFAGELATPTEGLTGRYSIGINLEGESYPRNRVYFMVSDYKLPDFELTVTSTARDVPQKGDVTISGNAVSYSGVPLQGVTVSAVVSTASWWRWFSPSMEVFAIDVVTEADGSYSFTIPDSVFAQHANDKYYIAELSAVSPSGTNAEASAPFSLGKQYSIYINDSDSNVDGAKPYKPVVSVTAPDGSEALIPLAWSLKLGGKVVKEGRLDGTIDLSGVTPGVYKLVVSSVDEDLAEAATADITIYNLSTDVVPGTEPLWLLKTKYDILGGRSVSITYGATADDTHIYYMLSDFAHLRSCDVVKVGRGYGKLDITLPADYEYGVVTLYVVRDCHTYSHQVRLSKPAKSGLKIEGESMRDKLVPGSPETWSIRLTGPDGKGVEGALVLDMYNKALEALDAHSLYVNLPHRMLSTDLWIASPYSYMSTNHTQQPIKWTERYQIEMPTFEAYGYGSVFDGYGRRSMMMMKTSAPQMAMVEECCDAMPMSGRVVVNSAFSADVLDDAKVYAEDEADGGAAEEPQAPDTFDYRDAEVPLAFWAPSLTTDADGAVTYSFTVPNANTTWRLRAVAWTQDLQVGTMMRDFVAQKPIMVMPNAPRFVRVGDTSSITCLVINNADTDAMVTTVVEMFDPLTDRVVTAQEFRHHVAAGGQVIIDAPFDAPADMAAIGYKVRATNGTFADGERAVLRVLPSEAKLVETTPFYLNPGDTDFVTELPGEPGARLSLTFTENPVWTIVSALPGLRQMKDNNANSAAAALLSASIARGIVADNPEIARALRMWHDNPADSTLVSMLERNEDLKIALLNATPWVQAAQSDTERMANLALIFDNKQTDAAIDAAIEALSKLQRADGGWAWGSWCDKSSMWVTSNVLEMLGDLKTYGWLPGDKRLDKMLRKAVKYYDDNIYAYSSPSHVDMLYCVLRPRFADIAVPTNGRKVIDATLKHIKKDWRRMTYVPDKAVGAEILYLNGEYKLAGELISSIDEFGVWTPTQGLTYPSVTSLPSYGVILDAYAMIRPGSRQVDGLRQQLIVRKQATDWGSAVVTSQVVASILSSGSKWTVDAQGARVTAGGVAITTQTPVETATGTLRADLSAYAGEELRISTSGQGPAYGAVYAQFERQIDQVEASSCDDLSITKQMWVRRGTEWCVIDTLAVGDRVKVQLTIHAKRNMQYVTVRDERPAALEPVDQLPGWLWSEGASFYRENRDTFTGLYIESLRPGTYLLTYEMNVSHPGSYLSGVATIQSQYAPELSAHSAGSRLRVVE